MPAKITVTANLQDVAGGTIEKGTLSFLLCGYFNGMPKVPGAALLGRVLSEDIEAGDDGNISTELWGNDVITPALTFYVATLKDDNGDVVQVAAYRFTGSGTIDLSAWPQLDMDASAGIVPVDLTVHVPYAPDALFDAGLGNVFEMLLAGDVAPVLVNLVPGDTYLFIFVQDGVGGRLVNWPASVLNPADMNGLPGGISILKFVVNAVRQLRLVTVPTYF